MEKYLDVAALIEDGKFNEGGFSIELESGAIASVSSSAAKGRWKDCIAVPGLVQSHVHLGQTLFRGMAEGRLLLSWLQERIWPFEASHSPDTLAVSVIMSLKELFSSGCTGLLDMGVLRNSAVTVDILRRSGARALVGNSLMDSGPEYLTEDLSWLREESQRVRNACGGLVGYVYTPRFALSCTDRLWKWLAGAPAGTKRTTHASESCDELKHPDIAECSGNIHFLGRRGFLGPDTLLAHCIHLQEGELDLLGDSGTTVVHCPWTNLRLGSGIADIPAIHSRGIQVTLGSDGAPCNNRLDLAGDIRLAMGLASVKGTPSLLPSELWFSAVTTSAGRAMGWKDTGRLAGGYSADIVLLQPSPLEWEELRLAEDPVRYVLELDWPRRVVLTLVGGRTVYRNGEFPTLPELPMSLGEARDEILARAGRIAPEAFSR